MINRTVVVNPVEPAILSLRSPIGLELDLTLKFSNQEGAAINPDTILPQLTLMSRSQGYISAYDIETTGSGSGEARVTVPSNAMLDQVGYTLEIYSRRPAEVSTDPPVANGLLAKGSIAMDGSAYKSHSALGPMVVPVVVGPPGPIGPEGPQGDASTVPGPTGQRGSIWTTGEGAPALGANQLVGDMYLDETSGDVWRYDGSGWVRGTF